MVIAFQDDTESTFSKPLEDFIPELDMVVDVKYVVSICAVKAIVVDFFSRIRGHLLAQDPSSWWIATDEVNFIYVFELFFFIKAKMFWVLNHCFLSAHWERFLVSFWFLLCKLWALGWFYCLSYRNCSQILPVLVSWNINRSVESGTGLLSMPSNRIVNHP